MTPACTPHPSPPAVPGASAGFEALGLAPPLTATLGRLGFERPTPVQERAVPPVLAGRDLVASAETGSGKTAAFLLPILHRLLAGRRNGGTRVLVLVPTRELAIQVHGVALELSAGTSIGCAAVYGGVGMDTQTRALRGGVDIVVATPGRLLDHAGRGSTRFHGVETLVLDEADRMLDMGFLPDIRRILGSLPARRQTLLFSATIPAPIAALAREVLRDPERIRIGQERRPAIPAGITHAAYPVPSHRKGALLATLLKRGSMDSVVVFCRTKHRADRLAKTLAREGFPAAVLHGDRSQGQRERALASFRNGSAKVLVATDLAARGLDIDGVTHVVNYDFPRAPEDYVHRVGRTARADARGDAFALVAPDEMGGLAAVERETGLSIPRVSLPEFDYAAPPPPAPGRGGPPRGAARGGPKGRPGRAAHASPAPGAPRSRDEFWQRLRRRRRPRR